MPKQARSSIRAQLLRLSLAIVAVSVAITLAGTLFVTLQGEQTALDNNLVNSASVLSQSPLLRQALEGEASRAELAEFLDAATANTSDIDLILVGDTQNILRYAPDSAMVGRSYPGDAQYRALAGEGAEIMAIAAFFPEYRPFVESNGVKFVVAPADTQTFQIPVAEVEQRLTPHCKLIL